MYDITVEGGREGGRRKKAGSGGTGLITRTGLVLVGPVPVDPVLAGPVLSS